MNIATTQLYALMSAQASSVDGTLYDLTKTVTVSAYLGTMAEMFLKLFNRLGTPSCTLVSGTSAGAVALATPTVNSGNAGIEGLYHGVPFRISAGGLLSADLASLASTTSMTIRKVLVGLSLGDISAVNSSMASTIGTLTFVIGSAFAVSYANAASNGVASAWFNQVPTPKASAGLVPVGIINIPTSTVSLVSNGMLTFPLREIYGLNLSALVDPVQP